MLTFRFDFKTNIKQWDNPDQREEYIIQTRDALRSVLSGMDRDNVSLKQLMHLYNDLTLVEEQN